MQPQDRIVFFAPRAATSADEFRVVGAFVVVLIAVTALGTLCGLPSALHGFGRTGKRAFFDAAQLAPYRHRRAPNCLKLPNAPLLGPRLHTLCALRDRFAVQIEFDAFTVYVFGDVLGDVSRRAAFLSRDAFKAQTVRARAWFVGGVFERK